MRKSTSILLLLVAMVSSGLALSLVATAQGSGTATASGPVVLTDEQDKYPLGLHLEILEDPSGQLTIEQVASPEYDGQFVASQAKTPNFGYTDSVYWVRFAVTNEAVQTEEWRLELDFAHMQHVALYTSVTQPDSAEPGFAVKRTGTLYPLSTRDEPFYHIVFHMSPPSEAEQTLYLRFQNGASMTLPLTLWSADAFARASRSEMLYWGIFYGVLLIMLAYSAVLFFSLRDQNYFYYFLFLVSLLLFQASFAGHAQQYLWPNLPAWNRYSVLFFTGALAMTALLFAAHFLELRVRAPVLGRFAMLFLTGQGLLLLLALFFDYGLLIRPIVVVGVSTLALALVSAIIVWRRGYLPARTYSLSWAAFLVSSILMGLVRYGLVPSTTLTEQGYLLGSVLTVLLLTLALADRINLFKAEVEQANLELQQSEARLQQYLEAMPVGVTVRDPDSRLRYMNRRARELRSWPDELPKEDVIWRRTLQENVEQAPLYVRGTQQAYPVEQLPPARALRGESASVEDVELDLGGQRIPLEIWSRPVLDEEGRVQYAVTAFRDIGKRVAAEAKVQDQLAMEGALAAISTRFVRATDLDQAILETMEEVGPLLGFVRLLLVQLQHDRGRMALAHEWCAPGVSCLGMELQGVALADVPWLLDQLRAGGTVYLVDTSELPPEAKWERRFIEACAGGRWCALPIWSGTELEGFLACHGHAEPSVGAESEARVLETVIGMLSSALQRAQVLDTLERRVADRTQELRTLYRVTTLTSIPRPLEDTLRGCLAVVLEALDARIGAMHLQEDRGSPLRLIAHEGLPVEAIDELAAPASQEIWWQQVLARNEPLLLSRDPCAEPLVPAWACLADVQVYVGVPIRIGGEPVGVLSAFGQSDRELTAEEMALLTTIADQLGVAVESDRLRHSAEEARVVEERQRLARDLHDAVTQSLYSLTLFARAARQMLQGGKAEGADQQLVRIGQMANHALKEMRLLIYQLRPSALEAEGLVGALEQRLQAVERRAGLEAKLIADSLDLGVTPRVEEALYRIAQEMLNNVLKHAGATEVVVTVGVEDGAVELAVRDNGCGFDPQVAQERGGMGLANIRQRVEVLTGRMAVTSMPGKGTEIRASVPVARPQEHGQEVAR